MLQVQPGLSQALMRTGTHVLVVPWAISPRAWVGST